MSSQLPGLQQGNEGSLDTETMHTRTYIMHTRTRMHTHIRTRFLGLCSVPLTFIQNILFASS